MKATRAELAGLPDDYIGRHKPGADGTYALTTDAPDSRPVFDFASNSDCATACIRLTLAVHSPRTNRYCATCSSAPRSGHHAGLRPDADLATADQMSGSAANVQTLLDQVDEASRPAARREYDELLAFAERRQPGSRALTR